MNSSPLSSVPPPPSPAKSGGCCCAGGCATILTVGFLGLLVLAGIAWYAAGKVIATYTSDAPSEIRIEAPTEAQFAAANATLEQLRAAAARNEVGTFAFTAADLNALIARHPQFSDLRNKVRVDIEGDDMLVDVSAPLSNVSWPGMSKRWFNGTAKLGLTYDDGSFDFALRSLTANGRELPLSVLPALDTTFDESVNTGFRQSRAGQRANEELWEHVKTITIRDNKVLVTTKPKDTTPAP